MWYAPERHFGGTTRPRSTLRLTQLPCWWPSAGVMGDFVNSRRTKVLAYLVATFILVLNVILVIQSIMDWV